jgi:ABC-type lipoprotein release transport system permease subunit
MMLIVKIVIRNIFAHFRKNAIIFAVTACVCLFLFLFLSFSDGEISNVKNGISSFIYPASDIIAVAPDYLERRDRKDENLREATLRDVPELKREIKSVPGVAETISEVWATGANLYIGGQKYLDFGILSIDPEDATLRSKYKIKEGADLAPKGTLLLHYTIKKTIGVSVGDEVTLVGEDLFGQVSSMKLTVAGFFEPYQDNVNLFSRVLLSTEDNATFAGYSADEANQVLIRLEKGAKAPRALEALRAKAKESGTAVHYYLSSDDDNTSPWAMVFNMIRWLIVSAALVTLFITAFGIMNVTSTNLAERKKEIGTYYCLGSEPPFLMAVYTLEIFIVNLAGSLAGIALGFVARAIINGMRISSTNPGFLIVAGGSTFTLGLSASTILWIIGGISLLTVLTALTTLGKALAVSPVVAVKETE